MSITAQYIIIGLIFAAIIVWQIRIYILRKKNGTPQSGCGCSGCSGCSATLKKNGGKNCSLKNTGLEQKRNIRRQ